MKEGTNRRPITTKRLEEIEKLVEKQKKRVEKFFMEEKTSRF